MGWHGLSASGPTVNGHEGHAAQLLLDCPHPTDRSIINPSANGPYNRCPDPPVLRDRLVAAGITSHGLPIPNAMWLGN